MSKRIPLTQQRAHELFSYDPMTGAFTWRIDHGKMLAGSPAGGSDLKGHLVVGVDYGQYQSHRVIWLWMTGKWPEHEVDHKDGDGENNRWLNLRAATHKQNQENLRRSGYGLSGFRGVHWDRARKKWEARIEHHGKVHRLGRHDSLLDAVATRLGA